MQYKRGEKKRNEKGNGLLRLEKMMLNDLIDTSTLCHKKGTKGLQLGNDSPHAAEMAINHDRAEFYCILHTQMGLPPSQYHMESDRGLEEYGGNK